MNDKNPKSRQPEEELDLEKITKILLREVKERENQSNKNELKKVIKSRVLGGDSDENQ
jgi:hypothetical protein